ncbi:unnamed protein product (mitochondrion) [Musa banksii]
MGTNEQGYHLLWPDLPTFYETSSLRAPPRKSCVAYACAPKRLLTLYNSVGRVQRAQTSHGAWIWFPDRRSMDHRRSLSPWPFAFESVLPSQCPGIHPMHYFR